FSCVNSASSRISTASLPPNSSNTPVKASAAMLMILLPPFIEPVKHTLATSSFATSAAPISASSPVTTFSTPAGRCFAIRCTARVVASGAEGGGLTTTVLPAISAYGSEAPRMATGQLNGTIIVTTPICLCDISVSDGGPGSVSTDSTSSAKPQASSVRCTRPMRSKVDSPITLPFSAERRAASVSESSITVSTAANNSSALRCGVIPAQSSKASLAAATASSA